MLSNVILEYYWHGVTQREPTETSGMFLSLSRWIPKLKTEAKKQLLLFAVGEASIVLLPQSVHIGKS